MISERALKKWRKESLQVKIGLAEPSYVPPRREFTIELCNRILQMTQELLDLHLIRKK